MKDHSTCEARIVARDHDMDVYHKELILWLCDQVDEYYRIDQQRETAQWLFEEIAKNGKAKLTGHALRAFSRAPFPKEVPELLSECEYTPVDGEDAGYITYKEKQHSILEA